jgi:hypothetical protein
VRQSDLKGTGREAMGTIQMPWPMCDVHWFSPGMIVPHVSFIFEFIEVDKNHHRVDFMLETTLC